jgi:hypothetical protein
MVTPKSVVETTPLVVARIKQLERAQRFRMRSSAPARPERRREHRDPRRPTRLVPAP